MIHDVSCSGLTEWEREREKEEFARSAALYRPLNSTMAARFTSAKQPDDHRIVYEDVPAQESSDSSDQTQAASMKMFGKLTRDSFEWHPENTLCKRFNIPNPYPGSRVVGVPKVRRPKFTLEDLITPQQPRALTYEQSSTILSDDSKSGKLGTISKSVDEPNPSDSKSASSELATKAFVAPTTASVVDNRKGSGDIPPSESQGDKTNETQTEGVNYASKRPSMDLFKAIFADSSSDESEASDGEDEEEKEKTETEPALIQASENKPHETASLSHVDIRTEDNNLASRFISEHKTLNEILPSKSSETENQKDPETQTEVTKNSQREEFESEIFGPAPPPSGQHRSSSHSFCREKHGVDTIQSKEDYERKKRKEKEKDTKKGFSDSTDSEDEYRSKHKHKHKEKRKHKHKHKSKHRDDEKERLDKKAKGKDFSSQSLEQTLVSEDKQILSKLKNLQNLKAGKRMRAADYM